jgi:hypothetical protein
MVSHATFFVAIALSLSDRAILIPVYMLVTFGLLVCFNLFESFRLSAFLKHWYPAECEKLITQAGLGPNFLLGLRSSLPCWGIGFACLVLGESDAEGNAILNRLRRHQRWIWIQVLSMPPVMFVVIVSAGTVSKHYGGG